AGAWTRAVAAGSDFRVTLVARDGRVVADSGADASLMDNHAARPEIAAALGGNLGVASRRSSTVGMELFYLAAPVERAEGRVGALRLALDLPTLEARLAPARALLAAAALLVGLAAVAAAALWSRRIARPIARLADAARALATEPRGPESGSRKAGETRRFRLGEGPEELRVLGAAVETMAEELASRAREAEAEGRERSAILDGMAEALLAFDGDRRLRLANPAARALFGLAPAGPMPRLGILEATRSTELAALVERATSGSGRLETELALYGAEGERWFQAVATPLAASGPLSAGEPLSSAGPLPAETGSAPAGAVIVLNDITRLRRLERVRQDFVANVSHELRTPVQLVKGFAESLRGGALAEPGRADRFLAIIERNAGRMESLIDDLLSLARLEQEGARLQCAEERVAELLEAAREAIAPRAAQKGIELGLDCPPELAARVNGGLVEQAVVNLLDNAVKYSPPGRPVTITARAESAHSGAAGDELVIEVRDRGVGIPAKDLPRVFERFYRVDKARSREQGGTGLGLAIVRHIARAHGGRALVESYEGEGTLFTLRLPLAGPVLPD
ncbi:MAG: PAS domain-containing protein, partial [Spirochaetaceae bacterium]|nr:PAS domain-containing protein [Spirochaetaceae bacterium]